MCVCVCVRVCVCVCVCVCILALVITIANRIFSIQLHIVTCGLSGCTIFFLIISWTARYFEKKRSLNIKCILWFCLHILSETFLIQGEFSELLSQKYISLHIKYPLFLQDFNKPWIFQSDFRKIHKYKISWKSVQWKPSCSMRTDMTALCAILRRRLLCQISTPAHFHSHSLHL